jgi:hypothetical protein
MSFLGSSPIVADRLDAWETVIAFVGTMIR